MLLSQEHQRDWDFKNISSNSFADMDDSSKTDENVPLTKSYEYFNESLGDNHDDYYPSFRDDFSNSHLSLRKTNRIMLHGL